MPKMWVWVVSEPVSLVHWTTSLSWGTEPALLEPCHQGQLSYADGEGWGHHSWIGVQLFHRSQGQLSCYSPAGGSAGSASPLLWAWMVPMTSCGNMAMNIITDPSRSRNTDQDMALCSISGLDVTLVLVGTQVPKISMTPVAARPLDTNGLWWLYRLPAFTLPLLVTGATNINSDSGCYQELVTF